MKYVFLKCCTKSLSKEFKRNEMRSASRRRLEREKKVNEVLKVNLFEVID